MSVALVHDFDAETTVIGKRECLTALVPERPLDAIDQTAFRSWERALTNPNEEDVTMPKTTTKAATKITVRQHDRKVLQAFEALLEAIAAHPTLGSPAVRDEVPSVLPVAFDLVSNGYGPERPNLKPIDRLYAALGDSLDDLFFMDTAPRPYEEGGLPVARARALVELAASKKNEAAAGEAWRRARAA